MIDMISRPQGRWDRQTRMRERSEYCEGRILSKRTEETHLDISTQYNNINDNDRIKNFSRLFQKLKSAQKNEIHNEDSLEENNYNFFSDISLEQIDRNGLIDIICDLNERLEKIEDELFINRQTIEVTNNIDMFEEIIRESIKDNCIERIDPTIRKKLDTEIESDDYLREFFSICPKIEKVPSPEELKESYYKRKNYDLY